MEDKKSTKEECLFCKGTGWIPHSEHRNSKEDYKCFKILLYVECKCKAEKKAV